MSSMKLVSILKYASLACVSSVISLVALKTVQIYRLIQKYKHIPGDEPKSMIEFYFGNLPDVARANQNNIHLGKYCENLINKYGSTTKIRLFDNVFILTVDVDLVKEMCVNQEQHKPNEFHAIFGYPFSERLLGEGALTTIDIKKWKHRRSLLNPFFHKKSLMQFTNEFNTKASFMINHLRSFGDGQTKIKLLEEFNRTTLDVIAQVAFGLEIDSINDRNNEAIKNIRLSMEAMQASVENPHWKWNPFKWGVLKNYKNAIRKLRHLGREQILKRIEAIKNDEHTPNDMLNLLLTSYLKDDSGEGIDIESIVDEFITFFLAGQETTASTMAFVLRELGRNPDVLRKLRAEIDTLVGSKSELEFADLAELKYMTAVLKETLRLYPVAMFVSRQSSTDIYLDKIHIPANSIVLPTTYASQRREENFPEPLKFRPERFLQDSSGDDNASAISSYVYYPFAMGSRNCVGQTFAQIEAKIMIIKFLQNFDFKLDDGERFEEEMAMTLNPVDGVQCFLTLRS